MKKLLFISVVVISLSSCKMLEPVQYSTAIDYDKVEQATGIRLSESNSVSYPHKTIATVYGYSSGGYLKGRYVNSDLQTAIQELCRRASNLGANEIINFKFERIVEVPKSGKFSYSCSGMAIKR